MTSNTPDSRVTLRDIARRLDVSHTTVSRALRNDLEISKAAREKVQNLAKEMGYKPDPMLSALSHYRRGKKATSISAELAWINHWPNPKKLRSYREFDLYWKGAWNEAERCGFRLEEFNLNGDMTAARLERILHARNIRGVLLPPRGDVPPEYGDLRWDDFCIVRFGHSLIFPHAHMISSDQLTDGLLAYENIWKNGYRRIGLVTSVKMHTRFSAGFAFSQMKYSSDPHLPVLVMTQDQRSKDQSALLSWLKKYKPDAILTDVTELRDLLKKAGFNVPRDIGLATTSVLDGNADAGIDQNSEEIGKVAVQFLISLINHNERGIPKVCREVLVEGRWVTGSTLPVKLPSAGR